MMKNSTIRCSLPAVTYGRVLFGMNIPAEDIEAVRRIFGEVAQLREIFTNPTIPVKKKLSVIDRIFPQTMHSFLKTVCKYQRMDLIEEIFAAYDRCRNESEHVIEADLYCTAAPGEEQKKGMEKFLCGKYGADRAKLRVHTDQSLLGGFILRVGSDEYDRSLKGRIDRLARSLGE